MSEQLEAHECVNCAHVFAKCMNARVGVEQRRYKSPPERWCGSDTSVNICSVFFRFCRCLDLALV